MAQDLKSDPVRTQENLHEAGPPVEAGRKGGAVAAASYEREGPVAARGYDYTAATSERSGLGWLLPLLVALAVTTFIIWGVMKFAGNERSSVGAGAPTGSTRPATSSVGEARSDQSTQGMQGAGNSQ